MHNPELDEDRWERPHALLDEAQHHTEIAVGILHNILPEDLGDTGRLIQLFTTRWITEAIHELACLAHENEIPRSR